MSSRLRLQLQVVCRDRRGIPDVAEARRCCGAALGEGDAGELTLRIVELAESRELNLRYRGIDRPTNVLSFPFESPPGLPEAEPYLGDLVVCAEVVRREAAAQGKPLGAHWAHMMVHGVLHLRGYDHITEAEAGHMEDLERRILAGLGFVDPYQPVPA